MKRLVAALLLAAMLCGCGDRSYTAISPHVAELPGPVGGEMRVENYAGLKNAILRLVENVETEGVIRLYNYIGDAEADGRAACQEIMTDEPLGAYAVASMTCNTVRILAYYETTVNISYRRTAEQIDGIRYLDTAREFTDAVEACYKEYAAELTAELPFYNTEQYDLSGILEAMRHRYPFSILATPEVSQVLYPESGYHRIVELRFSYPEQPERLVEMSAEVTVAAGALVADIAEGDAAELVRGVARAVAAAAEYLPAREDDLQGEVVRDAAFTAYGALVGRQATSEGFALAVKGLLDMLDVGNQIIAGRYDGVPHMWNLVMVDGEWYHLDAALCRLFGDETLLLKTDAEIADILKWNAAGYPTADGEVIPAAEGEQGAEMSEMSDS